jgi:hypothetical protein
VAEKISAQLGYDCISREVLLDASDRFHIPEVKLIRAIHDAPSILDRFTHGKQVFIAYFRSALANRVKEDNVVYHGLAGHLLLKGVPHVLKVRIIADLEDRIKAEMEREKISAEEARLILLKDDEERRKWTKSLQGVDPWDSSLYDLVVNIHKLKIPDAVDFICQAANREPFKTTPGSQQKMDDLALACQVRATLVNQYFDVAVTSKYGNVVIYTKAGNHMTQKLLKRVESLAQEIEGVNHLEIHSSGHSPPPDAV